MGVGRLVPQVVHWVLRGVIANTQVGSQKPGGGSHHRCIQRGRTWKSRAFHVSFCNSFGLATICTPQGLSVAPLFVKTFFFVLGYKYSKRQKIFPCLYAYSFKNHIDNQMIISITPDLKHYPRGVLSRILFFFLFWLFFIAFLFIKHETVRFYIEYWCVDITNSY